MNLSIEDAKELKQMCVRLIVIVLLVLFVIPTICVLSVMVQIPPDQNTVIIIPSRITLYQHMSLNVSEMATGNVEVNIELYDVSKSQEIKDSYYVGNGTWTINTFRSISRGDIAMVRIPSYGFKKVIPIA